MGWEHIEICPKMTQSAANRGSAQTGVIQADKLFGDGPPVLCKRALKAVGRQHLAKKRNLPTLHVPGHTFFTGTRKVVGSKKSNNKSGSREEQEQGEQGANC